MIDLTNPDYTNTPVSPRRPSFQYSLINPCIPPYITFVTPFYNTGPIFHETARSVLGQSFQQWEWLIVNDGSTSPESLSLLEMYRSSDVRIRVIDHHDNRGLSAARNTGFKEARTRYVVLLDSDDLLEATASEKWFWFLECFPEYAFVNSYSIGFGAKEYLSQKGFHDGKSFLEINRVITTSMIRKGIHQAAGGFDESNPQGLEDWDFWLRCAHSGYWGATIPEYLEWYRRYPPEPAESRRWLNMATKDRYDMFRDQLRLKYSALWKDSFPRIQPQKFLSYDNLTANLQCENKLRKEAPSLLIIQSLPSSRNPGHLDGDLLQQLTARGWEVTIVTTTQQCDSWLPRFTRFTPDVFILPHFLPAFKYPRFLVYLVNSRQTDAILSSNSDWDYLQLSYLKMRFPRLQFLDF